MGNIRKRATGVAAAAVVAVSLAGMWRGLHEWQHGQQFVRTGQGRRDAALPAVLAVPSTWTRSASTSVATSPTSVALVYRSLVTYPTSTDPDEANTPVPDLATDTGQSNEDATEWTFTLKDGVKWQDGKPITCEDLKYGVSRTFATDVITGGPNYILGFLDVPKDAKTGLPVYNGPYTGDAPGRLRQGRDLRRQHDHLPVQEAVAGLPAGDRLAARRSTPTAQTRTRATSPTSRSSPTAPTCWRARGTRTRAAPSCATRSGTRTEDTNRQANPD